MDEQIRALWEKIDETYGLLCDADPRSRRHRDLRKHLHRLETMVLRLEREKKAIKKEVG